MAASAGRIVDFPDPVWTICNDDLMVEKCQQEIILLFPHRQLSLLFIN